MELYLVSAESRTTAPYGTRSKDWGLGDTRLILAYFPGSVKTEKRVLCSSPPDHIFSCRKNVEATSRDEIDVRRQIRATLLKGSAESLLVRLCGFAHIRVRASAGNDTWLAQTPPFGVCDLPKGFPPTHNST
jgi:hypothetical protein